MNSLSNPTLAELQEYLPRLEARLKTTKSSWMKSEIRKTIELTKSEIARLEAAK